MTDNKTVCPLCKGKKEEATTTFTVELEIGIVVIRHVVSYAL